ncbi:MAG TPA: hypothetical protein VEI97_11410, partial [bacterium]|nr:hypothetical protein [bacterium]
VYNGDYHRIGDSTGLFNDLTFTFSHVFCRVNPATAVANTQVVCVRYLLHEAAVFVGVASGTISFTC